MRTFLEANAIRPVVPPVSIGSVTWGSYIGLAKGNFRRVTFIPAVDADISNAVVVEVYEAKDDAGTDAQELTTAVTSGKTFAAATAAGMVGGIEVRDEDLSSGYTHVTVYMTPAGTEVISCVAVLSEPRNLPVSNATTDFVAFAEIS
ncbi:MAG: hypothetical protein IT326_00560 [Anaerolineae bacterium]|nr:hypothetical protein [Anaerolineae bacterium]